MTREPNPLYHGPAKPLPLIARTLMFVVGLASLAFGVGFIPIAEWASENVQPFTLHFQLWGWFWIMVVTSSAFWTAYGISAVLLLRQIPHLNVLACMAFPGTVAGIVGPLFFLGGLGLVIGDSDPSPFFPLVLMGGVLLGGVTMVVGAFYRRPFIA